MDIGENLAQVIIALMAGAGSIFAYMRGRLDKKDKELKEVRSSKDDEINEIRREMDDIRNTLTTVIYGFSEFMRISYKYEPEYEKSDLIEITKIKSNLDYVINKLKK